LAWFIADVLSSFSEVCKTRGENELAKTYRARARQYVRNIDKSAWDGEWYRRGYYDDGTPLGSATNEEAKIDSLPQSWSVIAGGGDKDRSRQAMESAEKYLVKADEKMVFLFTPAFDKTARDPGYIKGYLPGVRENGGQYTHAACWFALALARAGRGDKAVEVLRMLNPVEHARTRADAWKYKVEPYVVAADVYALEGQVGRGGWTWYTGSCGWMYRVWMEEVLGFKKHGDRLLIDPAIPPDWSGFRITYRYGSAVYEIRVENPDRVMTGVASVEVDGKSLRGVEIPLVDDGQHHQVTVHMGERIVRRALTATTAEANPGETNGHGELREIEI
jgi:cyclic beta-1,2-glucan synthetase